MSFCQVLTHTCWQCQGRADNQRKAPWLQFPVLVVENLKAVRWSRPQSQRYKTVVSISIASYWTVQMLQNGDMGGCGRVVLEDIDPRSDCHCLNTKIVEQIKTCWHGSTARANSFVAECRSWGDPNRRIHGAMMCNVWPVQVIKSQITLLIRAPFQNPSIDCPVR